jgi:hypothetical protein
VAQDTFRFALNRVQQQKDPTFLLLDALAATGRAVKAGLPEVQAATLRARIHLLLDQPEQAAPFTTAALIGADGPGPAAAQAAAPWTAALLAIYARQQVALASRPFTAEADFPKDAVREAHGAWSTLTAHPAATEAHCEEHIGFLLGLHARRATAAAIRHAVGRFPSAARLHELFRDQALWAGGATGLARAYDALDATGDHRAATEWFAGYAALLAAESLVRDRDLTAAPPIYHKAIAAFDRSVAANAGYRPTASHYVALAHGGIARLALDGARYGEAVDAVLAGARSNPAAFPLVDGLKNTLKRTTTRLRRRVRDAPELKARLEDGLRTLRLLDE